MPWCPECDRFLSPSSVTASGACPRCGRSVDAGRAKAPATPVAPVLADTSNESADGDDDLGPIPWHLKLLAGAVALYLGFRAFQGVEWVVRQF